MTFEPSTWRWPAALVLAAAAQQASAGYVTLSSSGSTVLTQCNPSNSTSSTVCRVTSLPGESGFTQTASRSTPIVVNDATVGTVYEKIWRHCTDKTLYIIGTQVVLNANVWDETGVAFRVSDLVRRALPEQSVAVAYYIDSAAVALKVAGRTRDGQGEYDGSQPERDNSWADLRVDADGGGGSATAKKKSPWVLVKAKAPKGLELDPFGVRVVNATALYPTALLTTGYQPIGLPEEDDD